MNMPSERETVNLLDKLRESDRKLTEALLEIARPAKLEGFPKLEVDDRTDLEKLLDGDSEGI